jgi:hypothetical protein
MARQRSTDAEKPQKMPKGPTHHSKAPIWWYDHIIWFPPLFPSLAVCRQVLRMPEGIFRIERTTSDTATTEDSPGEACNTLIPGPIAEFRVNQMMWSYHYSRHAE